MLYPRTRFTSGSCTGVQYSRSGLSIPRRIPWCYGFRGVIRCQGGPFLSFAQAFSAVIVRINCQNGVPQSTASWTVDYVTTGVGTSTICLRSIKSSLYPLRHSSDKIFQALYRFSVLQVTESWVGPGNEARLSVYCDFKMNWIAASQVAATSLP